jgi:hypothetical protein
MGQPFEIYARAIAVEKLWRSLGIGWRTRKTGAGPATVVQVGILRLFALNITG